MATSTIMSPPRAGMSVGGIHDVDFAGLAGPRTTYLTNEIRQALDRAQGMSARPAGAAALLLQGSGGAPTC